MVMAGVTPNITHTDAWAAVGIIIGILIVYKIGRFQWPTPDEIQAYATVANTKGGIILILWFLWLFTICLTVFFCMWVIIRGVDPQHAVVISLLGVLTGTAFGNVNGAFFKAMTGEDPKPLAVSTVNTTTSVTSASSSEPDKK